MAQHEFSDLRLVGGTGLALQYGHRKSVDIDLFGKIDQEEIDIYQILKSFKSDIHVISKHKNIHVFIVNGIKIDFVTYNYPWLMGPVIIDNIRLAAVEDIAAMKLNAIAGRGSKKDFIDIDQILKQIPLHSIISCYKSKFQQESEFMVLKCMLYFADADLEVEPEMFCEFKWTDTKQYIKEQVITYLSSGIEK
jgi:hypothetical protein